jgi:hypothetical protein
MGWPTPDWTGNFPPVKIALNFTFSMKDATKLLKMIRYLLIGRFTGRIINSYIYILS